MLPSHHQARAAPLAGQLAALVRLTVLEAVRTRLPWLAAAVVLAAGGLAFFLESIAITETREVRVGVLAATLRLAAVLLVALFVIASILRELDDKVLELVLSLPLPRAVYLLGRLGGFLVVAGVLTVIFTLPLAAMADPVAALMWGCSLAAELAIVVALALLCLLTFQHMPVALSVVAAFYLLGRSMGAVQLMARGTFFDPGSLLHQVSAWAVDAVAFLVPDLYRFGRAEWLIHGGADPAALGLVLGQAAVYVPLLTAAALVDLYRREL